MEILELVPHSSFKTISNGRQILHPTDPLRESVHVCKESSKQEERKHQNGTEEASLLSELKHATNHLSIGSCCEGDQELDAIEVDQLVCGHVSTHSQIEG